MQSRCSFDMIQNRHNIIALLRCPTKSWNRWIWWEWLTSILQQPNQTTAKQCLHFHCVDSGSPLNKQDQSSPIEVEINTFAKPSKNLMKKVDMSDATKCRVRCSKSKQELARGDIRNRNIVRCQVPTQQVCFMNHMMQHYKEMLIVATIVFATPGVWRAFQPENQNSD